MTDKAESGDKGGDLEIELKLSGPPPELEAAWQSLRVAGVTEVTKRLVSTYFDTSDKRLRRKGLTLRVRREGKRYTQTIKVAGMTFPAAGGRREWSVGLSGPSPDIAKMRDSQLIERIGLVLPGELATLFTTDVTRRTRRYRSKGPRHSAARIEVALDQGAITSNGKSAPISEIEFELLSGSPLGLYREASKFHAATPLRYEGQSKADRGFVLTGAARPDWQKARQSDLALGMSVDEALGRFFGDCTQHWLANHAAVMDGRDPEAVHQMRVALRRLRSAVSVFRNVMAAGDVDWLQGEAKAMLSDLGTARDWDVFAEELLGPVRSAQPEDSDLVLLQSMVQVERDQAYRRAHALLASPRYTSFVLDLGAWLEGRGWYRPNAAAELNAPLIDLASRLLGKRHKRVLALGTGFASLPDEDRHRVRIALKKLRYAADFFASLFTAQQTGSYLKAMRRLQDDLGVMNDFAVAEAHMTELCAARGDNSGALRLAVGKVLGWHARNLAELRPRMMEDWQDFTEATAFWNTEPAAEPAAARNGAAET